MLPEHCLCFLFGIHWYTCFSTCGCGCFFLTRNKTEGLHGHNSVLFYFPIRDSKAPPWCWGVRKTISNHWFWKSNHEVQELKKENFPLGICIDNAIVSYILIPQFFSVPYFASHAGMQQVTMNRRMIDNFFSVWTLKHDKSSRLKSTHTTFDLIYCWTKALLSKASPFQNSKRK